MNKAKRATGAEKIAVVEFTWGGHNPGWFKIFVKTLLELGYPIAAYCPAPKEVEEWAQENVHAGAQLSVHEIREPAIPRWLPSKLRAGYLCMVRFLGLAYAIRRNGQQSTPADMVFFACIYDEVFRHFPKIARWFKFPCAGLYLHCRSVRLPGSPIPQSGQLPCLDQLLATSAIRGLAVIDEGAAEKLSKSQQSTAIVSFPDLSAENRLPFGASSATKLRRYAGDDTIVGIYGRLQATKGLTTFIETCLAADDRSYCFAAIGEVVWFRFSQTEQKQIRHFQTVAINAYAQFGRLDTEQEVNACIEASDIIFAAYHDFPNSSNILTKAAIFQKPVIVSDGFLMAERVRKFRLGEVVPEANPEATLEAIDRIASDPVGWIASNNPDWEGFIQEHSEEGLKKAFQSLLYQIIDR